MASRVELDAWLALILAPGLGTRSFSRLLQYFGEPLGWLDQPDRALQEAGLSSEQIKALNNPDPVANERCRTWLDEPGHHLIALNDPLYPPLLKQIPDPPPALFVAGNPDCLVGPQLAIVGSRNATPAGLDHARDFSATLAATGLIITSGLAAGIDGTAHSACLDAGGFTIAVTGTGLDRVYPARHRELAHRITHRGALVSQFPPGTGPKPGHFPVRNRLISGMSLGTLVVEAGLHSGSLITARLAATQGREVFALPATARDPGGAGCHRLIREGARLVTSVADVLEELPIEVLASLAAGAAPVDRTPPASAEAPRIAADPLLALLDGDGTVFDVLLARSGLDAAALNARLFELELEGLIGRERERWIRLR